MVKRCKIGPEEEGTTGATIAVLFCAARPYNYTSCLVTCVHA